MRIVFDLQSCQTPNSRTRGIGRYSLAHIQAFARQAREHEVILLLNNSYSDTIEPVREAFAGLVDPGNICVFSSLGGLADIGPGNQWRHAAAQELYQDFVHALRPDVFHVTSLFEGFNDAVTGIAPLQQGINSVTLYDLIPLQYAETYLVGEPLQNWYHRKLQALRSADLLLAISQSSRQEVIDILGLPPERVCNISSAIGEHFCIRPLSAERKTALQAAYGLRGEYILYTGGIDFRKNIEGLISAYALLPAALRQRYQLAVVCSVDQANRDRLQRLARSAGLAAGQLVLMGFVPEEDLVDLYNMAGLFVFPSIHEGFGLPALEAMACGVPTLVSNCSSLPEVVGRADMQFDPRQPQAISLAMAQTLENPARMAELREHGLAQARSFSWAKTAEQSMQAFEQALERKRSEQRLALAVPEAEQRSGSAFVAQEQWPRPRLAFVSPLPPCESGIADYSAELLPELARYYDIEVVTPQPEIRDRWLKANYPCRTPEWFSQHAQRYQRVLYQFGNSEFHSHMFGLLERHPGTVVLHDFYLSGILSYLQQSAVDPDCFALALYRSHGYAALDCLHREGPDAALRRYPANLPVLSQAQGVIVHSRHSLALGDSFYGGGVARDWTCLPLLRAPKRLPDSATAKQRLGLPEDSQVTASFGFVAPTKLNHELLEAWLTSQEGNPRAWLVLAGRNNLDQYGQQLLERIGRSPARQRIRITGFASVEEYNLWLAAADLTVQLRTGSRGETSAAVLDCLVAGKALIYNANGSAAELPEDVACRLPDRFDVAQLAQAITRLLADPGQARQLADAALAYRERHAPAPVARQYWQAIERFAREHPIARQHQLLERLRGLPEHAAQQPANLIELACAVTQNVDHGQLPTCYLDITGLAGELDADWAASLSSLLLGPPPGWRVELVERVDGLYQLACGHACRLLGLPARDNLSLLVGSRDAWLHLHGIQPAVEQHGRLRHVGLVRRQQLARLTPQELSDWLQGHPQQCIEEAADAQAATLA